MRRTHDLANPPAARARAAVHGAATAPLPLLAASLALALSLTPGCSWLFMEAAPPNHARLRYFDCTSSRAAPIIDTVFAASYGLAAIAFAAGAASDDGYPENASLAAAALYLGVGAASGASAVHGYSSASECEDAKARLAERALGPAPPPRGCGRDLDCAGERVCEQGACVYPAIPAPRPPAAEPAPEPPPLDEPAPAPPPVPPAVPPPSDGTGSQP